MKLALMGKTEEIILGIVRERQYSLFFNDVKRYFINEYCLDSGFQSKENNIVKLYFSIF